MSAGVIPIRSESEDGPYGCCNVCENRQTDDCEMCNEADLFELDASVFVEEDTLA